MNHDVKTLRKEEYSLFIEGEEKRQKSGLEDWQRGAIVLLVTLIFILCDYALRRTVFFVLVQGSRLTYFALGMITAVVGDTLPLVAARFHKQYLCGRGNKWRWFFIATVVVFCLATLFFALLAFSVRDKLVDASAVLTNLAAAEDGSAEDKRNLIAVFYVVFVVGMATVTSLFTYLLDMTLLNPIQKEIDYLKKRNFELIAQRTDLLASKDQLLSIDWDALRNDEKEAYVLQTDKALNDYKIDCMLIRYELARHCSKIEGNQKIATPISLALEKDLPYHSDVKTLSARKTGETGPEPKEADADLQREYLTA